MQPYLTLARLLDDISREGSREAAAGQISSFLKALPPHLLCPFVRLLLGELWPPWELREMGIGPFSVLRVLESISGPQVHIHSREEQDPGLLAEACLQQKRQNPLSSEPLEAMAVYRGLRKISLQSGKHSRYRKEAILRGLLLEATPLEGRYVVRTALRGMQAGLGPRLMVDALASAFHTPSEHIWDAFCRMPEMGMVANAVLEGSMDEVSIVPGRPVRPMLFSHGEYRPEKGAAACQVRYRGLRVQIHLSQDQFWVFTSRLRDITPALSTFSESLLGMGHELILDGELTGFKGQRLLSQAELVRFINRKHLSRRSTVEPRLVVSDLLFMDGLDLTARDYQDRRSLLEDLFSLTASPDGLPSVEDQEVSLVRHVALSGHQMLQSRGFQILVRDTRSPYLPGRMSREDFVLQARQLSVVAAVIEAKRGSTADHEGFASYRVALRDGDQLSPVGWVTVDRNDQKPLLDGQILKLAARAEGKKIFLSPSGHVGALPLMEIRLDGLRWVGGFSLIRPRVVRISLEGSRADVDALETLTGNSDPSCS